MDSYLTDPVVKQFVKLPGEDGYRVISEPYSNLGYVYLGPNGKWAAYSQYGNAMTDHIFDNPIDAAHMKGIIL